MPTKDCKQDWVGHFGEQTDTHTTVIISRKLDTNDLQDRPIANNGDQSRLLLAYSPYGLDMLHYHAHAKLAFRLKLFSIEESPAQIHERQTLEDVKNDPDVSYFDLMSVEYSVPSYTRTTYESFKYGVPAPELNDDFHIVALEHLVQPGNELLVHHFVLYGCYDLNPQDCSETEMLWGWAGGVEPLVFPNEVGLKMGSHGYKSFSINTHYGKFVSRKVG